ncbi:MAG TPA: DUF3887 domain-containing protein [Dokdonella sp.]
MSIRSLAWLLLFAAAYASAAPPDRSAPPPHEPAPEDVDVDALARAKDVGATPAAPADAAAARAQDGAAAPAPVAAPAPAAEAAPTAAAAPPAAGTVPIHPQDKRNAAGCESRAKSLLDAAEKGDFDTAARDFDAKMRSAAPPDKLRSIWDALATQFGTLQARGQSHPGQGEGYYLVMTPLIYEKATLVAQVACGSDGLIAGFYVKPLSAVQNP